MTADKMFEEAGLVKGVHKDEGLVIYQGNTYKLVFDIKRRVYYFDGIRSWSAAVDKEDWLSEAIRMKRKELFGI